MSAHPIAPAPFDIVAADVILRTSDNVDFYVYSVVLLLASLFFEAMFSSQAQRPVIHVPEDSRTLEDLLRFCYPVEDPVINDLLQVDLVLEAALKYDIAVAFKPLVKTLPGFVPTHSPQVYAIACRLGLEEVAKLAAVEWGKSTFDEYSPDFSGTMAGASYVPEMARIPAGTYYRLLFYLRTREEIPFCKPAPPKEPLFSDAQAPGGWPPFSDANTDIIIRSSDNIDFRAHTMIFGLPKGGSLLSQLMKDTHDSAVDGTPVLRMDADGEVLSEILIMCYPPGLTASRLESNDFGTFRRVIQTAQKYEMTAVIRVVKSIWKRGLEKEPLTMYLVAVACDWNDEAREALEYLATWPICDLYTVELEDTKADVYRGLLKRYHHLQGSMYQAMQPFAISPRSFFTPEVSVANGQWKQLWLTSSHGQPARTVPSLLLELEVKRGRKLGDRYSYNLADIMNTRHQLEVKLKQVVKNAVFEEI
ncbi:hypothetical protein PHLCEN_2v13676 [Hermanssonia centrifuga]|uniref:BTB domain-containing protein n=1 Tax=Hermanssonia centrifuga TaxID=98765 RepID=A0A2R6NDK2_9APHY|nr:hypothetical protein PHLCEN_2v13676 [Hermanssonia centrifuga]